MKNTIRYETKEDFYNGIQELTARGLTFDADFIQMTITLTGGY